jgi:hypothetical protein
MSDTDRARELVADIKRLTAHEWKSIEAIRDTEKAACTIVEHAIAKARQSGEQTGYQAGALAMREMAAEALDVRRDVCARSAVNPANTEEQAEVWAACANENHDGARAIRSLPTEDARARASEGKP